MGMTPAGEEEEKARQITDERLRKESEAIQSALDDALKKGLEVGKKREREGEEDASPAQKKQKTVKGLMLVDDFSDSSSDDDEQGQP